MLRAPASSVYIPDHKKDKPDELELSVRSELHEPQATSTAFQIDDSHQDSSTNSVLEVLSSHENLLTGLDDESDFPDGGIEAYSVVAGLFIGLLGGFGILNSTGVVQLYIQSNQLANVKVSTVTWIFSIYTFLSFFGGFIVGPLFDHVGSRVPLALGIVLFAAGLFGTANSTTVWQFILSFGVCLGMGTCFVLTPLLGVVSHWFLKRRAMSIGLAMAGASIGGVVYPLTLRSLYPKVGFVWAMRIVGFMLVGLLTISLILSKDRSDHIRRGKLLRQGWTEEQIDNLSWRGIAAEITDSIDFTLFKDKVYLSLTLAILFNEVSLFLVFTYYASYCMLLGISDSTLYILVTVVSLCGLPGRYIPGLFADKFGRFNIMFVLLLLMNVFIFILWIPFGANLALLYAFAALYGFSCGATLSLTPVCFGQISKTENFGKLYGTGYCVVSFALLVGLPIGGAIIGDSSSISGYRNMKIFAGVTGFFGTVMFGVCRYFIAGTKWVKV